jgi:TonB family protein
MAFMQQHLRYPEAARAAGAEGMVVVQFTVGENGKVRDAKVVKHGSHGMDEAALAVVRKMPQWTPGSKDGKAVATELKLPVKFKLDTKDAEGIKQQDH